MKKILLPILFSTILIKTAPTKASFYTTFDLLKLESAYRFSAKIGKNFTSRFDANATLAYQEDLDTTRDGFSFFSVAGSYRLNNMGSFTPSLFASFTSSISKNIGDFTIIDLGYKMASGTKSGVKYDGSVKFDYVKVGSLDSKNFVLSGNITFPLNKELSVSTGLDFTLNDKFHIIQNITGFAKSSLLAKIQLNYYYKGLWNLYYNNVAGESINIFGLKYSRNF